MEVTFETAFLLNGAPVGFEGGVPEHEPHLDNPAVRLGFGDGRADVAWNGKTLELAIAGPLAALEERYPLDAAGSPTNLLAAPRSG
jgi:hypothetical protein